MKPTKQTVLHEPAAGKHGNCLSAVLASLLHVPIETVPTFKAKHPQWQRDLNEWLRPFGLAYLQIGTFDEWCREVGISGCYHEVAGPTLRSADVLHACVGVDGIPVFDPHPDDTGVTEVHSSGVFIILEPWRVIRTSAECDITPEDKKLCERAIAYTEPCDGKPKHLVDEMREAIERLGEQRDELLAAAENVWQYRNGLLSRAGTAGFRECESGEWVADPWSQSFIDLGKAIAKVKGQP